MGIQSDQQPSQVLRVSHCACRSSPSLVIDGTWDCPTLEGVALITTLIRHEAGRPGSGAGDAGAEIARKSPHNVLRLRGTRPPVDKSLSIQTE